MSERAPPPPPIHHAPSSRRRWWWITAVLVIAVPIVVAVVVAGLFLQMGSFSSFAMRGGSMIPNLVFGDYFLVERAAHTGAALPQRGDIVAFHTPPLPAQGSTISSRECSACRATASR